MTRLVRSPASWFAAIGGLVLLLLASLASAEPLSAASPVMAAAAEGQTIFETKCSGCHTIGGGDLVGPDLQGVTDLRDDAWLTSWISAPDEMIAAGDPIALELQAKYGLPMPNLGLSPDEVASVIAYLASTGPGSSQPPAASAPPGEALPPGDATRGRNLYTGATRFANGGPPCLACHTISGIGALGGGALGPDHTNAYQRLGDAIITFPQTGTMLPIFGKRPLTPQEDADLLAFFRVAPVTERPNEMIWGLAGLAVLGIALLAGVAAIVWRNRLQPVRQRVVRGFRFHSSSDHTSRTEG